MSSWPRPTNARGPWLPLPDPASLAGNNSWCCQEVTLKLVPLMPPSASGRRRFLEGIFLV